MLESSSEVGSEKVSETHKRVHMFSSKVNVLLMGLIRTPIFSEFIMKLNSTRMDIKTELSKLKYR